MERVFSCADVIGLICEEMDEKSLGRSASVCRIWFEPAVRVLWRSMYSVYPLFQLLPSIYKTAREVIFEGRMDDDWIRFDLYAKYVKILKLKFHDGNVGVHEALSRLVFTRIIKCLVPNIEDLQIICDLNTLDSLLFIQPNLRRLTIHDMEKLSHFYDIFNYILPRTPNIVSLTLRCTNEQTGLLPFCKDFATVLGQLTSLEALLIDGFILHPEMLLSLSTFPRLRKLDVTACYKPRGFEVKEPDQTFTALARRTEESFPCLKEIHFNSHMETLEYFLFMECAPRNIEKVRVEINDGTTADNLRKCFEGFAAKWSNLKDLYFMFYGDSEEKFLDYSTFKVLSNLRHLQLFSFHSSIPVTITDEELDDFIRNWPSLISLAMNPDQEDFLRRLTLGCLMYIANRCKNIKTLYLGVDATRTSRIPWYAPVMEGLQKIYFGLSPIKNPEMVAKELNYICPFTCRILGNYKDVPVGENFTKYRKGWTQVSKFLDLKRGKVDAALYLPFPGYK